MLRKNRRAFTLIELIFVILIIGILTAVAVPRFASTSVLAYTSKAGSELAAVRSALMTERQKRILRGDTDPIDSLAKDTIFDYFSDDAAGNAGAEILQYPPTPCSDDVTKGCWSNDGASYTYFFADEGDAKFKLEKSKLICDEDAADFKQLEK